MNQLGHYLNISRSADDKIFVHGVQVIQRDVMATNGVMHVVDNVLVPEEGENGKRCLWVLSKDSLFSVPVRPHNKCALKDNVDIFNAYHWICHLEQQKYSLFKCLLSLWPATKCKNDFELERYNIYVQLFFILEFLNFFSQHLPPICQRQCYQPWTF